MTARTLTTRERNMLVLCIAVLLLAATGLMANEFITRRQAVEARVIALEAEKRDSELWL
jgi:hypothetical protein